MKQAEKKEVSSRLRNQKSNQVNKMPTPSMTQEQFMTWMATEKAASDARAAAAAATAAEAAAAAERRHREQMDNAAAAAERRHQDQMRLVQDQMKQAADAAAAAAAASGGPRNADGESTKPMGYKKLSIYSSGDALEFLTWREGLLLCAQINNWGDLRTRREAKAAIEDPAARMVRDIKCDAAGTTTETLLKQYHDRFCSADATALALTQYVQAVQGSQEPLLNWHGRLRDLFNRCKPQEDADTSSDLLQRWISGIYLVPIRLHVFRMMPESYNRALALAHNELAALRMTGSGVARSAAGSGRGNQIFGVGGNPSLEATLAAMDGDVVECQLRDAAGGIAAMNFTGLCFGCGRAGHIRSNCPNPKPAEGAGASAGGGAAGVAGGEGAPRGRGGGRGHGGGRGRGSSRGRGRGQGRGGAGLAVGAVAEAGGAGGAEAGAACEPPAGNA